MDTSKLEYLKKHYAFDEWRDTNRLNENLLIWKFFPSENELPGWQPRRIQQVGLPDAEHTDGPQAIQSIWQQAEGETETLLRVDTFECGSRTEAHAYLLQVLGEFQSPMLKRTETVKGDVAFTFPGETVVLFARANMVFLLRNAGRKVQPLTSFARQFDETLVSKPQAEGERGLLRVQQLEFSGQDSIEGESAPLLIDIQKGAEPGIWYKLFSSAGEMRLENGRPVYRSTAAGTNQVTVFIIQPARAARDQWPGGYKFG